MVNHIKDALKIDYLADGAEEHTQAENVKRAKSILEMYSAGENSFSDDMENGSKDNKEYCKKHIRQLKNFIKKYEQKAL